MPILITHTKNCAFFIGSLPASYLNTSGRTFLHEASSVAIS
jgi:hypothetical protein